MNRQSRGATECKEDILIELQRASAHLLEAQFERARAISAAEQFGLPTRQIAAVTNLKPSRVIEILRSAFAKDTPAWLDWLRDVESSLATGQQNEVKVHSAFEMCRSVLAEVKDLGICVEWLLDLKLSENAIVNVRLETNQGTEYVPFELGILIPLLKRTASNLEEGVSLQAARHRIQITDTLPIPIPKALSVEYAS